MFLPLLLNRTSVRSQPPVNTVAPAITGTATIGQELTTSDGTWTGSPTGYTYQWKRGGASIDGATANAYTLVDADFGAAITVTVTATNAAGSTAATSAATALVAEVPVQTLGAELLIDGDMEAETTAAWTAVNATLSKAETTPYAGTRCLRIVRDGGGAAARQSILVSGTYYELGVATRGDGTNRIDVLNPAVVIQGSTATNWIPYRALFRAGAVAIDLNANATASNYGEADAFTAKAVTANPQLTAPSANMRLDLLYTLPGTPLNGTAVWLLPRISDFATGNYWLALLLYTGSQWNINLYSVATHTRTSRIAATDIGATNGVRVNMNADSLSLYTTANGGTNWTQRGTTITNTTYQTATGVNALWTSDVTPGNLVYAAAA